MAKLIKKKKLNKKKGDMLQANFTFISKHIQSQETECMIMFLCDLIF